MRILLRIWIILLAGLFLAGVAAWLIPLYLPDQSKFEKIHEGMTRAEVEACLGKPVLVDSDSWDRDTAMLVYDDNRFGEHYGDFVVDIKRNKVTGTYFVPFERAERGFFERFRDRLRGCASWCGF